MKLIYQPKEIENKLNKREKTKSEKEKLKWIGIN